MTRLFLKALMFIPICFHPNYPLKAIEKAGLSPSMGRDEPLKGTHEDDHNGPLPRTSNGSILWQKYFNNIICQAKIRLQGLQKEKERASSCGTLSTPSTNQLAGGVTLPPNKERSGCKNTAFSTLDKGKSVCKACRKKEGCPSCRCQAITLQATRRHPSNKIPTPKDTCLIASLLICQNH